MVAVALKTITAKLANRHFTVAEVGAMLNIGATEVNNLIAEIAHLGVTRSGGGKRTVAYRGLFALLVARELIHCQLRPEMRPQILFAALKARGKRVAVHGTNLEILVEPYRKDVQKGLRSLYEAEEVVSYSNEIMQGEPCIKGTRVPVYILGAIAAAHGVEEALNTYPFLLPRHVEMALLYVRAHPRKGRPKKTVIPAVGDVVAKKVIKRKKHG